MAYTCLLYHLIIRTKSNVPAISENHERDLYAYIWGFCKGKRCVLHRVNGMADHSSSIGRYTSFIGNC